MWYAGTADAVYQNIDIIDSYAPEYIVILAGDHVYKMDYELMLVQHVNSGADVTVGCLEVPLAEATGFGVMHVDDDDRIVSFVEKPADPPAMPGRPDCALASMGIYVFQREHVELAPAPRRRRRRLDARLRQGHHPLDRQERQGGRAPLLALLRQLAGRGRALLARRRHDRRLLGGQHRPHRRRAGARPLTTATGRSGPTARSRRRRSSSTTRTAGAASASRRWSRAAASSPARRCCNSLLFTGVQIHSYATSRTR